MTPELESRIRECLSYDPITGILTWSNPLARCLRPGDVAGSPASGGHLKFGIGGRILLVHRVGWFLHYGQWPVGLLDHRDGVGSHNWVSNLRNATACENAQNRGGLRGLPGKGVYRQACIRNPFKASIYAQGKVRFLGGFPTEETAAEAYDKAARELHGGFAKLNKINEVSHA